MNVRPELNARKEVQPLRLQDKAYSVQAAAFMFLYIFSGDCQLQLAARAQDQGAEGAEPAREVRRRLEGAAGDDAQLRQGPQHHGRGSARILRRQAPLRPRQPSVSQ